MNAEYEIRARALELAIELSTKNYPRSMTQGTIPLPLVLSDILENAQKIEGYLLSGK